ncbi:MAG: NYN domain-containing protein [Acidobacteriota bacterium]
MKYLIDGSNVLGRFRADVTAEESKRSLVRSLGVLARMRRAKVVCFFDGPRPPNFGASLGSVQVVFSGPETADDLIASRSNDAREPLTVITSDLGLTARVKRRTVEVMSAEQFGRLMQSFPTEERPVGHEDWAEYFSDPQNRMDF